MRVYISPWRLAGYTVAAVPLLWFINSRLTKGEWHSSSLLMFVFCVVGFELGVRAGQDT